LPGQAPGASVLQKNMMQRPGIFYCQLFMRPILTAIVLVYSTLSFGQKDNKLSFALQLQPEITVHKKDYGSWYREIQTKATFNIGIEATVQYYLTERLFTETGLGYISRKLNSKAFLDQGALPPPQQSPTAELVGTKSISFRTLQLPLNFGYKVISREEMNLFLTVGMTGNILLNTYYGLTGFTQYEGAYKKNYWQGHSVNIGLGTDYKISKKFSITGRLTYSIINTMRDDEYLLSDDDDGIPLPHTYLRLSAGLRTRL
jgi:hypothetical protein